MNWGSERLIRNYLDYESKMEAKQGDPAAMLALGNDFLKELRREMGFTDSKNLSIIGIILTAEARKALEDKMPDS